MTNKQDNRTSSDSEKELLFNQFAWDYYERVVWFEPTKEQLKKWVEGKHYFTAESKESEEIIKLRKEQSAVKHKQTVQEQANWLRKKLAEDLIESLIEQKRKDLEIGRRMQLRRDLLKDLESFEYRNDYDELAAFVEAYLIRGGPEKKEQSGKTKKTWSYVWAIVVEVISVIIVLSVVNAGSDSSMKLVYSILVLIYLSIRSASVGFGQTIGQITVGIDTEFRRMRKLLDDEPKNDENEQLKLAKDVMEKTTMKTLIMGIGIFISYVIALWSLISALNS